MLARVRAALTANTSGRRLARSDAAVLSDCLCAVVTGPVADVLLSVWLQGRVPVQKVWNIIL